MKPTSNAKHIVILEKIIALISKKITKNSDVIQNFTNQLYANVNSDSLLNHNITDLYGIALSYWQFIQQYKYSEEKYIIQVYNPSFEQYAWQSPHTIVSILTEDMPFLVDSLKIALHNQDIYSHLIIHPVLKIERNANGKFQKLFNTDVAKTNNYSNEVLIHIEIDKQTSTKHVGEDKHLEKIKQKLEQTLNILSTVVKDWQSMRNKMVEIIAEVENDNISLNNNENNDIYDFLNWLQKKHFLFLGYREYSLETKQGEDILKIIPNSSLGLLNSELSEINQTSKSFQRLPQNLRNLARNPHLLILNKSSTKSPIHRYDYMDYIGIKRLNAKGEVIGERRFFGLYTSVVYHKNILDIPLINRKISRLFKLFNYNKQGYNGRILLNILQNLPREELFQISIDNLWQVCYGILQLKEQYKATRLFVRADNYNRFFSCLIYMPREYYDTRIRNALEQVLLENLHGKSSEFLTTFSKSSLVQIHYVIHTDTCKDVNLKMLEDKVIEITRLWSNLLYEALIEHYGEERGTILYRKYESSFPDTYQNDFFARHAVYDIEKLEHLQTCLSNESTAINTSLYYDIENLACLRFKLYYINNSISLSKLLPILENMGAEVIKENSYIISLRNKNLLIQDFTLHHHQQQLSKQYIKDKFQNLFTKVWNKTVENDAFNKLVLYAQFDWSGCNIFRAYAKYLQQLGNRFSLNYMQQALVNNAEITKLLLELFFARFGMQDIKNQNEKNLLKRINDKLNAVDILDEDRILRYFLNLIQATMRCNYFQKIDDKRKPYLAFKFNSALIMEMPEPRPQYEIFVYSSRIEGVHLRGGKVARGGLRWSDRFEDYRTEILGLVKAQMVKNTVIVPVGSKGGFVAKSLPNESKAKLIEGTECYKIFIRGLLDLTDNVIDNKIIKPNNTICHDSDDKYLVVAADKGTARFSDIANNISKEYNYWLDDAFASGGSQGYDHKKMGITARGAWEAVKSHCRKIGKNPAKDELSIIGIGGMSGDVFGNGLLEFKTLKLVAAFNQHDIFIDPNPNIEKSYKERQRLFDNILSWNSYDIKLISAGGNIFSRNVKNIEISKEIQKLLCIQAKNLTPDELIKAILRTPVDLLWNGGIGTYIKAENEQHADANDKANDNLRINAKELRCKIVGEGGNLGFTQLGRIEFAQNNGLIFTDAIDNSAGVDCSDHEVNIKILLNKIVNNEDMTRKQRNELLNSMESSVAKAVLKNNYLQTQMINCEVLLSAELLDLQARFLTYLEQYGNLNRSLEFLPNAKDISTRKSNTSLGLTSPELSVLMAYSKILLYQSLLNSTDNLIDDPYLEKFLLEYFPTPLPVRFSKQIMEHDLRREIIATYICNLLVNRAGSSFIFMLQEESGFTPVEVSKAFIVIWEIFELKEIWHEVENNTNISYLEQMTKMIELRNLSIDGTRWILHNYNHDLNTSINKFKNGIKNLISLNNTSDYNIYLSFLDVIITADKFNKSLEQTLQVYFELSEELKLDYLLEQINNLPINNRWQTLSRLALHDEINNIHHHLTGVVLEKVDWKSDNQKSINRFLNLLTEIGNKTADLSMLSVAIRELRLLVGSNCLTK
jgi:glutamate dehydrogenase